MAIPRDSWSWRKKQWLFNHRSQQWLFNPTGIRGICEEFLFLKIELTKCKNRTSYIFQSISSIWLNYVLIACDNLWPNYSYHFNPTVATITYMHGYKMLYIRINTCLSIVRPVKMEKEQIYHYFRNTSCLTLLALCLICLIILK